MVPRAGIEPARPEGHRILSPVRLPVSPPRHVCGISYLVARGISTAACGRRCIPPGGVARRSNTARVSSSSRLARWPPRRPRCVTVITNTSNQVSCTSLRAHRFVTFDTKNDVGAFLWRFDKTPQCHGPSQVRHGSEGGATSNARRRFEGEPLARGLTHQSQRRWRGPRFNRAVDPKADVGRREIDATHGFPQSKVTVTSASSISSSVSASPSRRCRDRVIP